MPPETILDQKLFNVHAAVLHLQRLGAGAATVGFVRGLINRGEIPHLRIGKKFYVSREALEGWISKRQRRTRS